MIHDLEYKGDKELWSARSLVSRELGHRLDDRLEELLEYYVRLYGKESGIEILGDTLCRLANRKNFYTRGWGGFVKYLVATSG